MVPGWVPIGWFDIRHQWTHSNVDKERRHLRRARRRTLQHCRQIGALAPEAARTDLCSEEVFATVKAHGRVHHCMRWREVDPRAAARRLHAYGALPVPSLPARVRFGEVPDQALLQFACPVCSICRA